MGSSARSDNYIGSWEEEEPALVFQLRPHLLLAAPSQPARSQ